MKKSIFLTTLALFALAACDTPVTSSSPLPQETIDEALSNPNRMLLDTMMKMATANDMATETRFEANGSFRQSNRETTATTQSIMTSLFSFDIDATLETNDLHGSAPQALLEVNINELRMLQSMSMMGQSMTQDVSYNDQVLAAYYDEGMAYIDLSGAEDLLSSLAMGQLPQYKLKFPVETPTELGLSPQEMTSEDQEAFINDWLPFVDTIPGLEATISGTFLNIAYEITQEDFNQMVRDMFLEGTENITLTSEESAFLEMVIEDTIAMVTINKMVFSLSLNLLTSQLTALLVDIDVEMNDTFTSSMIVDYDPENPNADEDGWVWEDMTIESLTVIDVFAQLTMESFAENRPIAILINKDEFELIDLQ